MLMFLEPTVLLQTAPLPTGGDVCVPEFVVYAVLGSYPALGAVIVALWKAGKARDNQFIDYVIEDRNRKGRDSA